MGYTLINIEENKCMYKLKRNYNLNLMCIKSNQWLTQCRSWADMFCKDQINLGNLGRGSLKNHLCQIISKSAKLVLTRRIFLKFSLYHIYIGSLAPLPGGHVFYQIKLRPPILIEGHSWTVWAKLFSSLPSSY